MRTSVLVRLYARVGALPFALCMCRHVREMVCLPVATFDSFLPRTPLVRAVRDLAALLLRLKYNVHPVVSDTAQQRVGIALFPAACYLNHSCDPNAVAHTVNGGNIIVFRSLRPIPAGEPVTYAYIDLYQTRQQRRSLLQAGYLFRCEVRVCMACVGAAWPYPALVLPRSAVLLLLRAVTRSPRAGACCCVRSVHAVASPAPRPPTRC